MEKFSHPHGIDTKYFVHSSHTLFVESYQPPSNPSQSY